MTEEVTQHIVKVLEFLKDFKNIEELTLNQIRKRILQYDKLLLDSAEIMLQDKGDAHGTLTSWWLYEKVDKVLYVNEPIGTVEINVEKAEDFVDYMLNSTKQT